MEQYVYPQYVWRLMLSSSEISYNQKINSYLVPADFYSATSGMNQKEWSMQSVLAKYKDDGNYDDDYMSTNIVPMNLCINNVDVDTYDNLTRTKPSKTYNELANTPCSAYVLDVANKDKGYWVCNDLEYILYAEKINESKDTTKEMKYFKDEYNFSTDYDKTEYSMYKVAQENLTGDTTYLSTKDYDTSNVENSKLSYLHGGGMLFTIFVGNTEYPMFFIKFDKSVTATNKQFTMMWNNDGMLRAYQTDTLTNNAEYNIDTL